MYEKRLSRPALEALPGPMASILERKRGACNRQTVLLRVWSGCVGEALKRKRIVRTAEVTIETEESIVLRASQDRRCSVMWCPNCRRQVEMVTPERAAKIAGVSERTIYRWVEGGKLHFIENAGHLLICVPALRLRAAVLDAAGPFGSNSENRKKG